MAPQFQIPPGQVRALLQENRTPRVTLIRKREQGDRLFRFHLV